MGVGINMHTLVRFVCTEYTIVEDLNLHRIFSSIWKHLKKFTLQICHRSKYVTSMAHFVEAVFATVRCMTFLSSEVIGVLP